METINFVQFAVPYARRGWHRNKVGTGKRPEDRRREASANERGRPAARKSTASLAH